MIWIVGRHKLVSGCENANDEYKEKAQLESRGAKDRRYKELSLNKPYKEY